MSTLRVASIGGGGGTGGDMHGFVEHKKPSLEAPLWGMGATVSADDRFSATRGGSILNTVGLRVTSAMEKSETIARLPLSNLRF